MTTTSTLADHERAAAGGAATPARAAADAAGDGAAASRRDLIAMHNSLMKVLQSGPGAGGNAGQNAALGKVQAKVNELAEAIVRMESLLAVNLRAEVKKAVREVAGPEAVMRVALRPRRLSRLLFLSFLVNLVLALGVLVMAVPDLAQQIETEILPRLSALLRLPALLARGLW